MGELARKENMELELIPQSDEIKFQDWFDEHDADLLCMECEDIARQSFMAGMKAAQQGMQPTNGGLCAICGRPEYNHSPKGHDFKPVISG